MVRICCIVGVQVLKKGLQDYMLKNTSRSVANAHPVCTYYMLVADNY